MAESLAISIVSIDKEECSKRFFNCFSFVVVSPMGEEKLYILARGFIYVL